MILQGTQVLNLSPDLSAAYCARMLANAGAEVVVVPPPANWLRPPGHSSFELDDKSPLARVLRRDQIVQQVPETPSDGTAGAPFADIVIDCGRLGPVQLQALRAQRPDIVVVNVLPFGGTGPWRDRPATEFTLQALTGSTINRGKSAADPLYAGGRLGDWITGAYAAFATLAALRRVRIGGPGEYIDVSEAEAVLVAYTMFNNVMISMTGRSAGTTTRSMPVPSVERTADGWIGLSVNTPDQFRAYLDMIGHPELIERPGIANPMGREPHRVELEAAAAPWLERHITDEIVAECVRRRIPVTPVHTVASIAELPHYAARGLFSHDADGLFVPRTPFLIDGEPSDAPAIEPSDRNGSLSRERLSVADELPLRGVRIVDLTAWWAGPCATQLLSALGATVIKVESHTRYDGMRDVSARDRSVPGWWEWSWQFQAVNTDKLGLALDLSTSEGRAALERVLAEADLLVENGTPGVLPKLGLDWPSLQERHPRLSVLRLPGFGLEGPWSQMRAYDPTISQASGVAALTGYAGGPPVVPRGFCDCTAGVHAAFAALLVLQQAAADGRGHHGESAMCDVIANVVLEGVLSSVTTGAAPPRSGNRGPLAAPQGVYACAGTEQWLAVAVTNDVQWQRLCEVIGRTDWAEDPDLADVDGRHARHDQLDEGLAAWCVHSDPEESASQLRAAGVPAEALLTPAQVMQSEHMRGRGFVEKIDHPVVGAHEYPSLPFRYSSRGGQPWFRNRAPMLGEHTETVLVDQAGMSPTELERLISRGVVGTRPGKVVD